MAKKGSKGAKQTKAATRAMTARGRKPAKRAKATTPARRRTPARRSKKAATVRTRAKTATSVRATKKAARTDASKRTAASRVKRAAAPSRPKAPAALKTSAASKAPAEAPRKPAAPPVPRPTSAAPPTPPPKARRAPTLDRERRLLDADDIHGTPSSLDLDRSASAVRSGRAELAGRIRKHTSTGPALTAGDVDADWGVADSVGDEAPGGDNPTPDQDVVEEIGRALGVEYDDDEELRGGDEIGERDRHRWELDPASSDDFDDREE